MELSRNEADSQRHYVSSLFFQARRRAAPRAQEPKGPKGPKGTFGALGEDGPMEPFGVIPKPFRMASYSEASPKAVPNGWPFRVESYSMCSHSRENAEQIQMDLSGCSEIELCFVE